LQREQVAAQNPDFSIKIRRVVIVRARVGCVAQALQDRVGLVDSNATGSIVNRSRAKSRDEGRAKNNTHTS
jgi:hypothetical protein